MIFYKKPLNTTEKWGVKNTGFWLKYSKTGGINKLKKPYL